jgi:hypothetical protein
MHGNFKIKKLSYRFLHIFENNGNIHVLIFRAITFYCLLKILFCFSRKMESIAEDKCPSLDSTPKYFAAIQITRPKSASKTGTLH